MPSRQPYQRLLSSLESVAYWAPLEEWDWLERQSSALVLYEQHQCCILGCLGKHHRVLVELVDKLVNTPQPGNELVASPLVGYLQLKEADILFQFQFI